MLRNVLICLMLTTVTAAVYCQVVGVGLFTLEPPFYVFSIERPFDFVSLEDPVYVSKNDHVRDGITRDGIVWAFSAKNVDYWRPVSLISHMVDCSMYGLRPAGHHLTSFLWHAANSLILLGLLRSMTRSPWLSAMVAALFALHPLHVESVAWITERKEVMSVFFGFLAICVYVAYVRRGGLGRYALMVLLLTLGLMAKPMLVTLPLVLLLLDFWPLQRMSSGSSFIRLVVEKLPLLPLIAAFCVITVVIQRRIVGFTEQEIAFVDRAANAVVSYTRYIGRVVWPRQLTVIVPHPNLYGGTGWDAWQVILATVLLLAITFLVFRFRRFRFLPMGWFWYLGTMVPVIGLVQVGHDALADRHTYLPLIGLFIIMAWGLRALVTRLKQNDRPAPELFVIGTVVVVICSAFSWRQLRHWRSSFELYRHVLYVYPNNPIANNNQGTEFKKSNYPVRAFGFFKRAYENAPNNPYILASYGVALAEKGLLTDAIEQFERAVLIKPNYAGALNNLGNALRLDGQTDKAIKSLKLAIEQNPQHFGAHHNLGDALVENRDYKKAIKHYRQALEIKGDHPLILANLGRALKSVGRLDEAISHLRRALELKPMMDMAQEQLNEALATKLQVEQDGVKTP